MSPTLILDCSITMSWCFREEQAAANLAVLDTLLDRSALVPAHWFLEVANVLAVAERKKRIAVAESENFLNRLRCLDIEVDKETPHRAFTDILPLCRRHGLTSYDAAYLELAVRRGLPLASLDDDLRTAARKLGVHVLGK